MASEHRLTFRKFGRSYQLRIATVDDLRAVCDLDEALWAATNAPLSTLRAEPAFLRALDTDGTGRVTAREFKAAIRWTLSVLADAAGVEAGRTDLHENALNADTPDGTRIADALRKIRLRLGKGPEEPIALDVVRAMQSRVASTPVSESGVALPEAADDPDLRAFLATVIAATGGADHPSGARGVDAAHLEEFLSGTRACLQWQEQRRIPPGQDTTEIMPLGADTPEAFAAMEAVRGKLDQFFAQCLALSLDERLGARMGWTDSELAELDLDDPAQIETVLAKAPLATPAPAGVLRFGEGVNPHYAQALERFRTRVAQPLLDAEAHTLNGTEWARLKAILSPHQQWVARRPTPCLLGLGEEKLQDYLDPRYASGVREILAAGTHTALAMDSLRLTERLMLLQGHLLRFANNFVSLPQLYDSTERAMMEIGSLVMDGRWFNLAVLCENRTEHLKVSALSSTFLLYVQVSPAGAPPYEVVVPVTSGSKGNLQVGKRGVFHDVQGRESDAIVVQILENPISLREAMAAPFIRIWRLISGKIESLTTEAEKKLDAQTSVALTQVAPGALAGGATAPGATVAATEANSQARAARAGMFMGAGVALAAVGSAIAYITKTVADLEQAEILWALGVAVLVVLVPTTLVAALKLRKRDLSAILEGSGWAINPRLRLTPRQRRAFTHRPRLPKGSRKKRW